MALASAVRSLLPDFVRYDYQVVLMRPDAVRTSSKQAFGTLGPRTVRTLLAK
jgi:hypothetical protein